MRIITILSIWILIVSGGVFKPIDIVSKHSKEQLNKIHYLSIVTEFIKLHEGFSSTIYICTGGYPTIGYGHVILPYDNFTYLTEKQANEVLRKDILKRYTLVKKDFPELSEGERWAVTHLAYCKGLGAVKWKGVVDCNYVNTYKILNFSKIDLQKNYKKNRVFECNLIKYDRRDKR